MQYPPPGAKELTPSTELSRGTDLAAMFDQLMLEEQEAADNELQEKLQERLGRFYVETGRYNEDRIKRLKAMGFRWEPSVKHWWATERALMLKEKFIGTWPQYHLTDQDKENLREVVRATLAEGAEGRTVDIPDDRSYSGILHSPSQEQRREREAKEQPSPGSAAKKSWRLRRR